MSSSKLKVSDMLARAFAAEGVDHLFTLMGDANMYWSTAMAEQRTAASPPAADALPSAPADAMVAPPSPGATPPAPTTATELSATSLLWRAFLSWLRDLAGKGERPR